MLLFLISVIGHDYLLELMMIRLKINDQFIVSIDQEFEVEFLDCNDINSFKRPVYLSKHLDVGKSSLSENHQIH